jgi:ABC-type sulfate transport system substrate-binding protein
MITIHKYQYVNELVHEMTDNKALQTFYTLYLMADKEAERIQLNTEFKQAWQSLSAEELAVFKQAFTESFKQLLPIAQKLHQEVKTFPQELRRAA